MEETKSKIKIKELEEQLAKLQREKAEEQDDTDILKLKRTLLIFKKKYQRALQDLSARQSSPETSALHKKLKEAEEEQKALIEQQQNLKQILKDERARLKKLQEKYNYTLKRLNVYETALFEKSKNPNAGSDTRSIANSLIKEKEYQRQVKELQAKIKALEELNSQQTEQKELLKVARQKEDLEQKLAENSQHADQLQRALNHVRAKLEESKLDARQLQNDYRQALEKIELLALEIAKKREDGEDIEQERFYLREENEKLLEQLTQLRQKEKEARQELRQMKEALVTSVKKVKELKIYHQNQLNEKIAAIKKNTQLKQTIELSRNELKKRDEEIKTLSLKLENNRKEKGEVEKLLEEEKEKERNLYDKIKEKEDAIRSLENRLSTQSGRLKSAQDLLRDKDSAILEAQQHIAKKMKEISALAEKITEKRQKNDKLQYELEGLKTKQKELQAKAEALAEHEKEQKEKMAALEKKYFKSLEQSQILKTENSELKKVAEKYDKMQQLLTGLGTFMDTSVEPRRPLKRDNRPKPGKFKKVEAKKSSREPNFFDLREKQ